MQSQLLEAIAHKACFSIDQQERQTASNSFLSFIYSLQPQHFPQIMNNFSQTVLFVFSQYVNKYFRHYIQKGYKAGQMFDHVQKTIRNWFTQSGILVRNQKQKKLQIYNSNSVSLLFGKLMKHLFAQPAQKKLLLIYLKNISNLKYKIFVYKSFIEGVGIIQSYQAFLDYKALIYNFQEQIIPLITQDLVPFFIAITQKIKVNQISCMMPRLSQSQSKDPIILVRQQDKTMTQLIFNLLKQVTNFNYNISFNQYDLQTVYENCLVCFPESLISKIISKEFLESLYFVIYKMIYVGQNNNELMTCFECLKKILLTKTCFCNKQTIATYIKINLSGLNNLFQGQNISRDRLIDLIECAQKFIVSIQITQLKTMKIYYLNWISNIKSRLLKAIKIQKLNHENNLLFQAADLILKLIGEALSPLFKEDLNIFVDISTSFGFQFINCFLSKDQSIMGDVKILKLSHFQKISQEFFRPFLQICSINTSMLIQNLFLTCDSILTSKNIPRISNFFLLISQISRQNYLERNVLYETEPKQNFIALGGIIHKIYQFIDLYKCSKTKIQQLDVAILIFINRILQQLLHGIQINGLQIKLSGSIVYFVIQSFKKIPSSDQEIVIFHLKQLIVYLFQFNSIYSEYILDAIYKHLLKTKWGVRRDVFKQTKLYSQTLKIAIQVSKQNQQNKSKQLKWRKKLFRVIGLLCFDDITDQYKNNINFILEMIQSDIKNQVYNKVLYDLTGICQNIDSPVIYRYFLAHFDKRIGFQNLMYALFHTFSEDQTMFKHVLKLSLSIIENKAQRFIYQKILIKFYQIINILLPFWSQLLFKALRQQQSNIINQLYKILAIFLGECHINMCLVKRCNKNIFQEFVFNLIKNVSYCHSWIVDFPKINNRYLEVLSLLSSNHLEIILSYNNNSIIKQLNSLLQNSLERIVLYFQEIIDGKKKFQKSLSKLLDFVKNFFSYLRKAKQFKHKSQQIKNVQFLIDCRQNKQIFLFNLYKFGFGNLRNFTNIYNLTILIIEEMSYIYKESYKNILIELRIFGKRADQFYKIYKKISQDKEDNVFVMNLKDWMKQCENDCQPQIDY